MLEPDVEVVLDEETERDPEELCVEERLLEDDLLEDRECVAEEDTDDVRVDDLEAVFVRD